MKSNFQIALLSLLSISLALPAMAQQTGEATFKAKCAMCHGTDGTGNTQIGKNMKIRSLKSADDIKETDAELLKQTKEGVGKWGPTGKNCLRNLFPQEAGLATTSPVSA
jgi:cytochrome c5